MRHVAFIAPRFLENTNRYVRAFAELDGVTLSLISLDPEQAIPAPLRPRIAAHYRVADLVDSAQLIVAVRAIASAVGRFDASTERKYNVGVIFKRAKGQGRISGITGLRDYVARYGPHIVEDTLLRPGTTRRDWKNTLLSDGYLVVRHPDWDQARAMAMAAATDIQLYAS